MGPLDPIDGTHGWAEKLWGFLADGGVWGVPRSGLIFEKRGETEFSLIMRAPWQEGLSVSAEELREIQDEDLVGIRNMFAAIGVVVTDETVFDNTRNRVQ